MAENIFQQGMNAFDQGYDRVNTFRQDRAKVQAGRALSAGNYGDAAASLGQAGMIGPQTQLMDAQHQQQLADTQRKADSLVKVAQGLKAIPAGQRAQALQTALPTLRQAGIDPTPFAQLDDAHLSDQQLDQFTATLGKAVEEYTLAPGAARYRGTQKMAEQPLSPKYQVLKPGDTLVSTDPNDAGTVAGSNAPPAAPAAPATAPQPTSDQPRGIRNNNPLNVTTLGGGQKWDGQTGADGKYATFATPEAGLIAADKNLQAYSSKHGINTIEGVIQRWAPSNENDTQSYIQTVAGDLGVDPKQRLDLNDPNTRMALLHSMAKVELGKPLPATSQPGAPSRPAAGPAGARVLYQAPAAEEDAGINDDTVQLLAGRYLKDGTLPPLGMGKAAAASRQKILNEASKMAKGLGLDAGDLIAGTADVKATASALGKMTTQISQVRSFENTASKNADLALTLAPKGASPINVPVLNRWIQTGRRAIAGDPNVTSFDIALGTFLDEYAKIVSGATGSQGTTDASRREAYDRLSKYATQGQLQAGIATMKVEMHNRITSMEDVQAGLRSHLRGSEGASPAAAPAAAPPPAAPARPKPKVSLKDIFG
jgi:hypothetical protein